MKEKVLELALEFVKLYDTDGERSVAFLPISYEVISERYKLMAHRSIPYTYKTLYARLVALHAILQARGVDAFEALKGRGKGGSVTTGAVRSISIGDSSTTFASSSGANLGDGGSDGAIDQNNELARDFKRLWQELIVNTRRLL